MTKKTPRNKRIPKTKSRKSFRAKKSKSRKSKRMMGGARTIDEIEEEQNKMKSEIEELFDKIDNNDDRCRANDANIQQLDVVLTGRISEFEERIQEIEEVEDVLMGKISELEERIQGIENLIREQVEGGGDGGEAQEDVPPPDMPISPREGVPPGIPSSPQEGVPPGGDE
jgi:chromosome segregation ATPase